MDSLLQAVDLTGDDPDQYSAYRVEPMTHIMARNPGSSLWHRASPDQKIKALQIAASKVYSPNERTLKLAEAASQELTRVKTEKKPKMNKKDNTCLTIDFSKIPDKPPRNKPQETKKSSNTGNLTVTHNSYLTVFFFQALELGHALPQCKSLPSKTRTICGSGLIPKSTKC